jgi:IS5 family transposase
MLVTWRIDVEAKAEWRDLKAECVCVCVRARVRVRVRACIYISPQICNNVVCNNITCFNFFVVRILL